MNPVPDLIQSCEWGASHFLLFSSNVFDPLIYYSHLAVLVPVLLIGGFVFLNGRNRLPNILLFITTLLFTGWILSDSVLWATESPALTMFFWTLEIIFEPLIYFFLFYFFYTFIFKRDLTNLFKVLLVIPVLPTLLFASTRLGLLGYDLTTCDRDAYEGALTSYGYGIELLYLLLIIGLAIYAYRKSIEGTERKEIVLIVVGITAFLFSLSLGNIIGGFDLFPGDYSWSYSQYGLFGAPIFAAFLAYIIVRFKAFNTGLLAAQALIMGLIIVLGAEFAFVKSVVNTVLVSVTLVLTGVLGIMLIRSVRRDIEQRERIELLAKDLELANKQQVALIHFITHQLKGFVAKSRNIFSMLQEGDYGAVPETMKPLVDEGFSSSTKGAQTIQDILNASNIKSGKMAYQMAPFDFTALVDGVAGTLKPNAEAKGVALTVVTPEKPVTVTGDQMQLENALKNLVDNTIKYTQQGSIKLSLTDDGTHVRFTTVDTGVGITPEDMQHLFTEGGHGAESQKVNVDSTGFGLYIVKNIIEAHGGKVWAESEGAGKGSTFVVELPVQQPTS